MGGEVEGQNAKNLNQLTNTSLVQRAISMTCRTENVGLLYGELINIQFSWSVSSLMLLAVCKPV